MRFLGVLAMGCHLDGIVVSTAPRIYPDEVRRKLSKRTNSQLKKKQGKGKKKRKYKKRDIF